MRSAQHYTVGSLFQITSLCLALACTRIMAWGRLELEILQGAVGPFQDCQMSGPVLAEFLVSWGLTFFVLCPFGQLPDHSTSLITNTLDNTRALLAEGVEVV